MARQTAPVQDWAKDFEVLDAEYIESPFSIWADLRQSCPVARTERHGGAWLLTRYADVAAAAHDTDRFSSLDVGVVGPDAPPDESGVPAELAALGDIPLPPITADPPVHTWTRRLLLPWFSPQRVAELEPVTRSLCRSLIAKFVHTGTADAAADYAQQIPVRVIAMVLGVPESMSDTFTGWVRDVLEFGDDQERSNRGAFGLLGYLLAEVEKRKAEPGDDLISYLISATHDGEPLDTGIVLGMVALILIAGIDTTWSGIGSALFHLATHSQDAARLAAEPALMPTAVEEMLRAYSPVTMARVVKDDTTFAGCPMHQGDKLLLSFPAANRDPAAFDRADEVVLDRAQNRHVAFGVGIHRCAGSNLARMELRVALEEWLAQIPDFRLVEGAEVTWAGGQVRGPRSLRVAFPS